MDHSQATKNRVEHRVILLVEDNPDSVELALRAFRKNNVKEEIVVAKDGVEALDYMFARGAFADRDPCAMPLFILLDLKLPKMNGLEVLQQLRADDRTKLVPIVILSSSKEKKDIISCYGSGANSYIRKSVDYLKFVEDIGAITQYWLVLNESVPLWSVN